MITTFGPKKAIKKLNMPCTKLHNLMTVSITKLLKQKQCYGGSYPQGIPNNSDAYRDAYVRGGAVGNAEGRLPGARRTWLNLSSEWESTQCGKKEKSSSHMPTHRMWHRKGRSKGDLDRVSCPQRED